MQADAFAASGRTGDLLICRPSSAKVPFLPLPRSSKVRCVTGSRATIPFLVFMVRICILRIQSVILSRVCSCTECYMRLHLVLDRSSAFSEQTSLNTFSPLWRTPNGLSPSGLSDSSVNDSQRRSSGGNGEVSGMWVFYLEDTRG